MEKYASDFSSRLPIILGREVRRSTKSSWPIKNRQLRWPMIFYLCHIAYQVKWLRSAGKKSASGCETVSRASSAYFPGEHVLVLPYLRKICLSRLQTFEFYSGLYGACHLSLGTRGVFHRKFFQFSQDAKWWNHFFQKWTITEIMSPKLSPFDWKNWMWRHRSKIPSIWLKCAYYSNVRMPFKTNLTKNK